MADEELDITPMEIDEPDDDQTAINGDESDAGEYLNWDRDKGGPMSDHATDDEPTCLSGDDAEKGV